MFGRLRKSDGRVVIEDCTAQKWLYVVWDTTQKASSDLKSQFAWRLSSRRSLITIHFSPDGFWCLLFSALSILHRNFHQSAHTWCAYPAWRAPVWCTADAKLKRQKWATPQHVTYTLLEVESNAGVWETWDKTHQPFSWNERSDADWWSC